MFSHEMYCKKKKKKKEQVEWNFTRQQEAKAAWQRKGFGGIQSWSSSSWSDWLRIAGAAQLHSVTNDHQDVLTSRVALSPTLGIAFGSAREWHDRTWIKLASESRRRSEHTLRRQSKRRKNAVSITVKHLEVTAESPLESACRELR